MEACYLLIMRNHACSLALSDETGAVLWIVGEMCRICHCYAEDSEILISPCSCNGSMKYVHQTCLQKWVKSRDTKKCELCSTSYDMTSSVKPFRQVRKGLWAERQGARERKHWDTKKSLYFSHTKQITAGNNCSKAVASWSMPAFSVIIAETKGNYFTCSIGHKRPFVAAAPLRTEYVILGGIVL